jgi:hypothetical protein
LTQSFAGVDKVVRVQLGRAFLDTIARLLPEDEHADALLIAMLPLRVAVSHGAGIHLRDEDSTLATTSGIAMACAVSFHKHLPLPGGWNGNRSHRIRAAHAPYG